MFKFEFRESDGAPYTGLQDKNGKKVYQNDMVLIKMYGTTECMFKVCFGEETIDDNEGYGENKIIGFYLNKIGGILYHMDYLFEHNFEVI